MFRTNAKDQGQKPLFSLNFNRPKFTNKVMTTISFFTYVKQRGNPQHTISFFTYCLKFEKALGHFLKLTELDASLCNSLIGQKNKTPLL